MTTARLWVTLSEGVKNSVLKNIYDSICDVSLVKQKDMDHIRGNADIEEI